MLNPANKSLLFIVSPPSTDKSVLSIAIDRTLLSVDGGETMNKRDLFAGLSMKDIEEHQQTYADEVRKLYGKEIAEETEKRTSAYSADDWRTIILHID